MGKITKTFLYFAYGSNLLEARLLLDNPTAIRYGIGKLNDYRLDFNIYSQRWQGASATIAPKANGHVWGAVWQMNVDDIEHLDAQESVASKVYFPFEVDVAMQNGTVSKCRTYQHCEDTPDIGDLKHLPKERQPSAIYLNVIKEGAKQSKLPADYLEFLNKIPDNGFNGPVNINMNFDFCKK